VEIDLYLYFYKLWDIVNLVYSSVSNILAVIYSGEIYASNFKYLRDRQESIFKNGGIFFGVLALIQSALNIIMFSTFGRVFMATPYQ
jgi:hypothetical protein